MNSDIIYHTVTYLTIYDLLQNIRYVSHEFNSILEYNDEIKNKIIMAKKICNVKPCNRFIYSVRNNFIDGIVKYYYEPSIDVFWNTNVEQKYKHDISNILPCSHETLRFLFDRYFNKTIIYHVYDSTCNIDHIPHKINLEDFVSSVLYHKTLYCQPCLKNILMIEKIVEKYGGSKSYTSNILREALQYYPSYETIEYITSKISVVWYITPKTIHGYRLCDNVYKYYEYIRGKRILDRISLKQIAIRYGHVGLYILLGGDAKDVQNMKNTLHEHIRSCMNEDRSNIDEIIDEMEWGIKNIPYDGDKTIYYELLELYKNNIELGLSRELTENIILDRLI